MMGRMYFPIFYKWDFVPQPSDIYDHWREGGAFLLRCWNARKQSSMAAGMEVEVLPMYVHTTDGVLSKNLLVCLKDNHPETYSSTRHSKTRPDNSRSSIVSFLFEFLKDTSLS